MRVLQILILVVLFAVPALAHRNHDWRTDKAAYQSYREAPRLSELPKQILVVSPFLIDPTELKTKLQEFVAIGTRGSAQNKTLARQWLAKEYQTLGYVVSEHKYSTGVNFVAEKSGTSGKTLIISSHLDSVGNAGANDNGIGTIGALLIAKKLKDLNLTHGIRIVAFDQEERGLIGSDAYAKELNKAHIIGDIQMEMMGVNKRKDGQFHIIDCSRSDSLFLTEAILAEMQAYSLPITRSSACTNRSDHASFWDYDMPAVVLSENFFGGDADPCYHATCDVVDRRLNLDYASSIATAVAGAAAKLTQ